MPTKKELKWLLPFIIIILIFVYFARPDNGPILPCIFNRITGLYCPGCGMSRAVHSLLKFQFYNALMYNILIFIIPPLFILYYLFVYNKYIKLSKITLILMILITLGYGIIRNIEVFSSLSWIVLNK